MSYLVDHPLALLAAALVAQCAAAYLGDLLRRKVRPIARTERADFDVALTATLSLLALLLGFSFSMAVNRYDQRKNYEAAESNAIAAEYRHTDLLSEPARSQVRQLLPRYVDERVRFYREDANETGPVDSGAIALQAQLWSVVASAGTAQPNPVVALAVSGLDQVFIARGSTRASWANRIPTGAWALLGSTALLVNLLLGYRERRTDLLVLSVLPVVVSIAMFLIADIDSPRAGLIRVSPTNLELLAKDLQE